MSERLMATCVVHGCRYTASALRVQTIQDALMDHVIECHPDVNVRPVCDTPIVEPPTGEPQ